METKIHLSPLESDLVKRTDWILAKRSTIDKVSGFFGMLAERYRERLPEGGAGLPAFLRNAVPRIARGENYLGLPYVMMDFPAVFHREGILAVRTFFWWGHFFSITLHVSGKYVACLDIAAMAPVLEERHFFVCVNTDEWNHTFEPENYAPAGGVSDARQWREPAAFLKIAKRIGVEAWEEIPLFLEAGFRDVLRLLEVSYRCGEADPLPGLPTGDSGP